MTKHRKKHKYRKNKKTNLLEPSISPEPQKTTIKTQNPEKKAKLFSSLKKLSLCLLAFLTLLGSLTIFSFYPHVSIQETTFLQPGNPFYYPFIVKNSGNIPVIDFSFSLGIDEITRKDGSFIKGISIRRITDTIKYHSRDTIPRIKADGTHPIDLSPIIGADPFSINRAKVYIIYKYSIPIFKFQFRDSTKFVLFQDSFRGLSWKEFQY
jgi:hypothetical protein